MKAAWYSPVVLIYAAYEPIRYTIIGTNAMLWFPWILPLWSFQYEYIGRDKMNQLNAYFRRLGIQTNIYSGICARSSFQGKAKAKSISYIICDWNKLFLKTWKVAYFSFSYDFAPEQFVAETIPNRYKDYICTVLYYVCIGGSMQKLNGNPYLCVHIWQQSLSLFRYLLLFLTYASAK